VKDNVKKVLKEPVQVEFSDSVKKIRNNLMMVSFISLFVTIGEVDIRPDSKFFGLGFDGLDNPLIFKGLLIILIYLLIHFIWSAYDTLQEWEIRVTGTNGAFYPADRKDINDIVHPDYPADARNSTFYYWCTTQASKIGNLKKDLDSAKSKIEGIENSIHKMRDEKYILSRSDLNISSQVQPIKLDIESTKKTIERIEKVLESNQLIESMETFDRRFKFFLKSQNIRWFIIDFSAPILLATSAILKMIQVIP
jgi:hypothetical protein